MAARGGQSRSGDRSGESPPSAVEWKRGERMSRILLPEESSKNASSCSSESASCSSEGSLSRTSVTQVGTRSATPTKAERSSCAFLAPCRKAIKALTSGRNRRGLGANSAPSPRASPIESTPRRRCSDVPRRAYRSAWASCDKPSRSVKMTSTCRVGVGAGSVTSASCESRLAPWSQGLLGGGICDDSDDAGGAGRLPPRGACSAGSTLITRSNDGSGDCDAPPFGAPGAASGARGLLMISMGTLREPRIGASQGPTTMMNLWFW
mmetsp:Transcript_19584/g.67235  ORF Transcript_19584/g.67235 Transcript_19584/m.67235 type:complete len:265 (-) Transcript_19584:802-1596(-)